MMQVLLAVLVPTCLNMTEGYSITNGAFSITSSTSTSNYYCYFETCVWNTTGYPAIGQIYNVAISYYAY